jgi:hypothetical protein
MSTGRRQIYSMTDIVRESGIAQKNLILLLELYGDAVPTLMDGERRRYPPEAVSTIKRLWRQYNAGLSEGDAASSPWHEEALSELEAISKSLEEAAGKLRSLQARLKANPPRRVFYINTLPGPDFDLRKPVAVLVEEAKPPVLARLEEVDLEAEGKTARDAVINLREAMVRTFVSLRQEAPESGDDAEQLAVLSSLILVRKVRG